MTLLPKAELVLGSASDTLVRTGVGLGKPLAIKSLGWRRGGLGGGRTTWAGSTLRCLEQVLGGGGKEALTLKEGFEEAGAPLEGGEAREPGGEGRQGEHGCRIQPQPRLGLG